MYVLTEIAELETTNDSCVDRVARSLDHNLQTCLVGRQLGETWRCGGNLVDSVITMGEEVELMEVVAEERSEARLVKLPKNYQVTGKTVWKEPKLMSPFAARPLFLAMVKEGRDTLIPFFQNYLDPEIHLLTHYSSSPAWKGSQFCFWSARGRAAVRVEECTMVRVVKRTVVRNPIRRAMPTTTISTATMDSRKRVLPEDGTVQTLSKAEVARRLEAYRWMQQRGKLEDLRLEVDSSVSVVCDDPLFCSHNGEDDGSCSVILSNQSRLASTIKTFYSLVKK